MKDFDEDIWKMVLELAQEERHFNGVQHHYRLLASTWLLAVFAGVGFALTKQNLSVPAEMIVGVIGFAGAIGITQLWNLDIRVYHQLLDSCFVQGLKLELENPWLPQVRSSMLSSQSKGLFSDLDDNNRNQEHFLNPKGALSKVVWFYVVATTISLLICLTGFTALLGKLSVDPVIIFLFAIIGTSVIGIWAYQMLQGTGSPLLKKWIDQ